MQSHAEKRERVSSADVRTRRMQHIVEKYEREAQLKSRLLLSQHVRAASAASATAATAAAAAAAQQQQPQQQQHTPAYARVFFLFLGGAANVTVLESDRGSILPLCQRQDCRDHRRRSQGKPWDAC